MASWKSIKRQLDQTLRDILPTRYIAWTGWADGTLVSASRPNFIHITMQDGSEVDAWNDGVAPTMNTQVDVYTDKDYPGLLRVKQPRLSFASDFPFISIKFHHENHEWPGGDTVSVDLRQFMPLHPSVSGFNLTVRAGWIETETGLTHKAASTTDLTSYIPATSAVYILVTFSKTGVLTFTEGIEKTLFELTLLDIPARPAGHTRICAIRLYQGQTAIVDSNVNTDLIDLRFASKIDPLDLAFEDGDIIQSVDGVLIASGVFTDAQDPTGWLDPAGIVVTYDKAQYKITLTHASGELVYYWKGIRKVLTSPWVSAAHSSSDGNYFLYSSDGETFAWSTDIWTFNLLMVAKSSKSTSPAHHYAMREPHGLMPWQVHKELHQLLSAYRISGGGLVAGTYAENTASDAATTPGFASAVMADEDIETTLAAWAQGTYTTMRIGVGAIATFDITATFPFRSSGSYILVNDPLTGGEAPATNNSYVNIYQILVPTTADADSQAYRMLMLQPQVKYNSLAAAKAEAVSGLNLGDLATVAPEFVFYARITYVLASGDANTGKCRIATGGVSYISGSRVSQVISPAIPNAENIPFVPFGTIASTNVQDAIEEVLAEAGGGTGDMLKAVYDTDDDGIVDSAAVVDGVDAAGNSKYWGTNGTGTPGFYDLPVGGVEEAPIDGTQYARIDAGWEAVSAGGAIEDWITPTLLNSWEAYGGTEYEGPGYYKRDGRVYLRGLLKNGTIEAAMFTLPVGYRPPKRLLLSGMTVGGTFARLDILANGDVYPANGSNGYFSISAASFRVD